MSCVLSKIVFMKDCDVSDKSIESAKPNGCTWLWLKIGERSGLFPLKVAFLVDTV